VVSKENKKTPTIEREQGYASHHCLRGRTSASEVLKAGKNAERERFDPQGQRRGSSDIRKRAVTTSRNVI